MGAADTDEVGEVIRKGRRAGMREKSKDYAFHRNRNTVLPDFISQCRKPAVILRGAYLL